MFGKLRAEIRRHWRSRAYEIDVARGDAVEPPEAHPEDEHLEPPDAARVARRALALSAVALRGLSTTWPEEEAAAMCGTLGQWLQEQALPAGLSDELEPVELEVIQRPAGQLKGQAAIDAVWRWEGAAVLAAALGRYTLPPYDQPCDPRACGDACGLLRRDVAGYLASAAFDAGFGRDDYASHALAVHWRVVDLRVRPQAMDLRTFAAGVQWARFNLDGARFVNNDLAVGDVPIAEADPDSYATVASIARERHQAANWLLGWDPLYSEVDTST